MILQTNSLIIKSTDLVLADEIVKYQIKNKNFVKEYEPNRNEEFYSMKFWEDIIKCDLEEEKIGKSYHYYIYVKENPDILIGFIGLNDISLEEESCILGYQLDKDYINKGYMTEALKKIIKYALENLKIEKIRAYIMSKNIRSIRVIEKLGFKYTSDLKKSLEIDNKIEEHICYEYINKKL